MYANARSHVPVGEGYSEEFEVKVGVHQGLVLSPLLFIIVLEALSREFHSVVPWEDLYADDLVIIAESLEECVRRLLTWKEAMEKKGLRVNAGKTKIMTCGTGLDHLQSSGEFPCAVCCNGVGSNSIFCNGCKHWVHKKCSAWKRTLTTDVHGARELTPLCWQTTEGSPGRTWQAWGGSFLFQQVAVNFQPQHVWKPPGRSSRICYQSSLHATSLSKHMAVCTALVCRVQCSMPARLGHWQSRTSSVCSEMTGQWSDRSAMSECKTLSPPGPMSYLCSLALRIWTLFWRREDSDGMDMWNAPMVQSRQPLTYRLMESMGWGGPKWHGSSWQRGIVESGSSPLSTLMIDIPGDLVWDLPCMQQASYLEGGPLMWMLPLYLHVNKKSNYDMIYEPGLVLVWHDPSGLTGP